MGLRNRLRARGYVVTSSTILLRVKAGELEHRSTARKPVVTSRMAETVQVARGNERALAVGSPGEIDAVRCNERGVFAVPTT